MKKAIIVFSLGLSLILVGSLLTLSEMSKWNTTEATFESVGFKTEKQIKNIDISMYEESSISINNLLSNPWFHQYISELPVLIIKDVNQAEGVIKHESVYYPMFGKCDVKPIEYVTSDNEIYLKSYVNLHMYSNHYYFNYTDEFPQGSKVKIDIHSDCYQNLRINNNFIQQFVNYDSFKKVMEIKKLPVNLQQVIVTINPKDEAKFIK